MRARNLTIAAALLLLIGAGQALGAELTAAGFEEDEFVVPADGVKHAGLASEIKDVDATAKDDMLGIESFGERGVVVGVGAASDVGPALEKGDLRARFGKSGGGGEPGCACAHNDDVGMDRSTHAVTLLPSDIAAPCVRIQSFSDVGTLMRRVKTSLSAFAILWSSSW